MPRTHDLLLIECKRIEENSLYTGQTHFEMAAQKGKRANWWLVLLPSLISAGSGLGVALGAPKWVGAFAALSGVVSGVSTFLGVAKEANAHETAGKLLTQLRDEARALRETYSADLSSELFAAEVRALGNRYRAFVASLPLTSDKAFEKVRQKIKTGTFQFDFDAAGEPGATSLPPQPAPKIDPK